MNVGEIVDITHEVNPADFYRGLSEMLEKHNDNVDAFLSTVFSFVNQKTTYFKNVSDPRVPVIKALREADVRKTSAIGTTTKTTKTQPPNKPTPPATSSKPNEPEDVNDEEKESEEDKGLKPNEGNGADYENYSWTQSLAEVFVSIPVPAGLRARDISVKTEKKHLDVSIKATGDTILKGEFSAEIRTEDVLWNYVDGKIELSLSKANGMTWWKNVLIGDPEINTQKVTPENSNLGDLDAETRQTVEKMMEDQRRKQLGMMSTEDEKKKEILEKFMKAHPEMDFSQANIN